MSCTHCGTECDVDNTEYDRCFTSALENCSSFGAIELACPSGHMFERLTPCQVKDCGIPGRNDLSTFCVECKFNSPQITPPSPPAVVVSEQWFLSPVLLISIVVIAFFVLVAYALSDNPERSKSVSRIFRAILPAAKVQRKNGRRVSIDLSSTADAEIEFVDVVEAKNVHDESVVDTTGEYI